MALIYADRIKETASNKPNASTSFSLTGTGDIGFKSFDSVMTTGDSCIYCALEKLGDLWEIGVGTFTLGTPSTLARPTNVLSNSSNTTSKIDFSSVSNDVEVFIVVSSSNLLLYPLIETYQSPTISSGSLILDLTSTNTFLVSLSSSITSLSITNVVSTSNKSAVFTLVITYPTTDYSRTISWPSNFKFSNSVYPSLTNLINSKDIVSGMSFDNGTTWLVNVVGTGYL